jgi:hypothetical protein
MQHFTLTPCLACLTVSATLLLAFSEPAAGQDWPVLGRNSTRNAVIPEGNGPMDWDVISGRNIKWRVSLGSETYAAPVVAGGQVYIGTNNGAGYLERFPSLIPIRDSFGSIRILVKILNRPCIELYRPSPFMTD